MTKFGLDIQTISTKLADFHADPDLLLSQVTKKKEKAHTSHFLKFIFAKPHCRQWVLHETKANASQNEKSTIFAKQVSNQNLQYGNK